MVIYPPLCRIPNELDSLCGLDFRIVAHPGHVTSEWSFALAQKIVPQLPQFPAPSVSHQGQDGAPLSSLDAISGMANSPESCISSSLSLWDLIGW
jgi:hypothetical protein